MSSVAMKSGVSRIAPPVSLSRDGKFTNIIIGGGTAGCLLANRLSADPKRSVLLIEAGDSRDGHPYVTVPAGYLRCIGNPLTDWMYNTTPQAGLKGRQLKYPRGKILGGCSSINGMLYVRGQSRDYDRWAKYSKDDTWRWDAVLPYFRKHERHWTLSGNDGNGGLEGEGDMDGKDHNYASSLDQLTQKHLHNGEGEVHVVKQRLSWAILDKIQDAVVEVFGQKKRNQSATSSSSSFPTRKHDDRLTVDRTQDFNTGNNSGVGYFEVNQKDGQRWNASRAFLPQKVRDRKNLAFMPNATVQNLIIEKDPETGALYTVGVRVQRHGKIEKLYVAPSVEEKAEMIADRAEDPTSEIPTPASLQEGALPEPEDVIAGEVVLAAGSIGTAQILQLSGVGPTELLQDAGVTPLHNLPVGLNLQDHLQLRTIWQLDPNGKNNRGAHPAGDLKDDKKAQVKDDGSATPPPVLTTMNTQYHSWAENFKIGLDYLTKKRGPLTMAPSQLGCFLHSELGKPDAASASASSVPATTLPTETDSEGKVFPDLEFHIQPLSLDAFGKPLHKFDAFTLSVCNLNPTSRGYVMIKDNSPYNAPEIHPNYLHTAEDQQVAANAIRVARKIATQSKCLGEAYGVTEYAPGAHMQSHDRLVEAAAAIGTTIFHPVSTCAMGPNSPQASQEGVVATHDRDGNDEPVVAGGSALDVVGESVVTPRLKVRGIAGLRIADASVIPFITSGNTNAPTMMIAEKAAEWILTDSGGHLRVPEGSMVNSGAGGRPAPIDTVVESIETPTMKKPEE